MKLATNTLIAIVTLSPAVASAQYTVTVDADNDYALYTGNSTTATTFYGYQYNSLSSQLHVAQSYNVTLNAANDYVYVATWGDLSGAAGLLVDLSSSISGNLLLPSGSIGAGQWQVAATGMLLPASAPPPDVYFSDPGLANAIAAANSATDPSGGWVTPTDYTTYDNAQGGVYTDVYGSPGIVVPQISPTSQWMWYEIPGTGGGDAPFYPDVNDNEYLLFRMPATAVPEPASAGLIMASGIGVLGMRRRKTA
ncbi:MAG: PEP-CTERM sorting domain-containing protein [Tepidisphaeraceae bacterium]|jgi:hypothetical protein